MVKVEITADESTSLQSIIAAMQVLAGGEESFPLPEKLSKREETKEKKETKGEETPMEQPSSNIGAEGAKESDTNDGAESARSTEQDPEEDSKTYTIVEVRAALGELSKAGKTAEVREILKAAGAKNVSTLDPSKFAEVMAAVAAL